MMARIDVDKIAKIAKDLDKAYGKLPETEGCFDNICKENGCNSWCCQLQNPQVLYCEFIRTWSHIIKTWDLSEIVLVIGRAVRNYVKSYPVKGCVFFDANTKTCSIHAVRCFNCRLYSIIPDEEFTPRYNKLKEIYKDNPEAIREQCHLVHTVGNVPMTKALSDEVWNDIVKVEYYAGIAPENINDGHDGSYRTYHDHLMLYLIPPALLSRLTEVKLLPDGHDKETETEYHINRISTAIFGILQKLRETKEAKPCQDSQNHTP
jgi:Fe-S-cluster containining protein